MLLNNEWVKNDIKESKSFWKQMKMNSQQSKIMGHSLRGKAVLRGKFIAIQAYQKRKISNKQPNPTDTRTRGTTGKTAQSK